VTVPPFRIPARLSSAGTPAVQVVSAQFPGVPGSAFHSVVLACCAITAGAARDKITGGRARDFMSSIGFIFYRIGVLVSTGFKAAGTAGLRRFQVGKIV
jgi:hypothetical protein